MPKRSNKSPMRNLCLALVLVLLQTTLSICSGFHVLDTASLNSSGMEVMVKKACAGKLGLCFWETKNEMEIMDVEMDSEINRRVLLVQKKYISYETLRRDMVPCDRPGASYYKCHAMGQANPYTRGCEEIAGCRNGRS
ncbi:hypothetical protein IFM89_023661 [Coptis chinensis]|uniref:Uncharacterized protein n=1 Tax=Coptis chinensis TaxID=261450 RepID=A0A835M0H4_9MAGN|nr:hypothetical protein IFM89_023661 [Coptis chinensis]